jgi:hypothetical protein
MGKKKRLRVPPEVSHERAEPLGINVGVSSGGSASLPRLAPRSLRRNVAAVCRSAWAEMTGNPRALAGVLLLKSEQTAHAFVNCSFTKSQFIKFHQAAI